MRAAVSLTCLLLGLALAGCIDGSEVGPVPPAEDAASFPPQAVVALVDTGIDPYHVAFRDDTELGHTHPSRYLAGYPADAVTVELTLNATDAQAAREADQAFWDSVEPGTLYWFKGTKIVGAIAPTRGSIFDTGHGTMTASRAAANEYSLCPECRIVMVQGFTAASVTWASEQPWIDAQSNSWSPLVVMQEADPVQSPGLTEAFAAAAERHLVFGSAGNGVGGKLGVLGHPSFTRSTSGPAGVVSVGGHDNGEVILWSGSAPHVVADACSNWAAVGGTLDEYDPKAGGGTSSASPYAAGAAARIILEARLLLDDRTGGVADGIVARGEPGLVADGPLADGSLTLDEVKDLLYRSATPRPVHTEHDGDSCRTYPLYNTLPVAWADIPQDAPSYYYIGWGQVSVHSLALALSAVAGAEPLPERPETQEEHERFQTVREAYRDLPV